MNPKTRKRVMPWSFIARAVFFAVTIAQVALAQANSSQAFKPYPPDTPGASHASTDLRKPAQGADEWLFPLTKLNQSLPPWVQFGGQFRDRIESQDGFTYKPIDDAYNLTQLRLGIYLQPTKWLELVAVTQDSRVFFNHHVPNGPPYQNIWDVREAYLQLGSSTEGWFDIVAGRQIFSFGDERVIGPSDWNNIGRTFDAVRVDLHPRLPESPRRPAAHLKRNYFFSFAASIALTAVSAFLFRSENH